MEDSLVALDQAYRVTLNDGAGWIAVPQEQHTDMRAFTNPADALRTAQMPDGTDIDLADPGTVCDETLSSYAWHAHMGGTFRYEIVGEEPVWLYFAADAVGHAPEGEDDDHSGHDHSGHDHAE